MQSTHTLGNLFEGLGVAGWGELEPRILCALKTKTPVNLIGDRGTSKTEFCSRITRALLGPEALFQKYDTPDLSLDDVLGFRNLKDMENGKMSYVATGTAIWNKNAVLWDEPNRATPLFQSKLLEVVRTGTIHGMPTPVVFQFGACNPPRKTAGSVGHDVHFMPDALAARFFHVEVPRTSAALYDAAMSASGIREAFDTHDTKTIGQACAPLHSLWLDFAHAKPTQKNIDHARLVVRFVLQMLDQDTRIGNFFDTRAAIRTTHMLAELFLNKIVSNTVNLQRDACAIVVGNIAEMSKLTRTDHTQYHNDILVQVGKAVGQIGIQSSGNNTAQPIISHAFSMLRENKLDQISRATLIDRIGTMGTDDLADAFRGILRKVPANDKYRSPNFRKAHKDMLAALLEIGQFTGTSDIPASGVDTKDTLHAKWYTLCGL